MAAEMKAVEIVEAKDEESVFEKLKKESSEAALASSEELLIETIFLNFSKGSLKRIEMHFWNGETVTSGDQHEIPINGQAHTLQKGTLPKGIKYGVVYTDGADADDTQARKFVVAIDSPAGKIYAEAGPMGRVDWNVVEVKLGMAGTTVEYEDPILGGKVVGRMAGFNAVVSFYK